MPARQQGREVLLFGAKSYWSNQLFEEILKVLEPHLTEGKKLGLDVDEQALKFFESVYDHPRETYLEAALDAFEPNLRRLEESGRGDRRYAREYFEGIYDHSTPKDIVSWLMHDFLERRTKRILGKEAEGKPEGFSLPYPGLQFFWEIYKAARDKKATVFALERTRANDRRARLEFSLKSFVEKYGIPRGNKRQEFRKKLRLREELKFAPREIGFAERIARDGLDLVLVGSGNIGGLLSMEIPGARLCVGVIPVAAYTEPTKRRASGPYTKSRYPRSRYLERLKRAKAAMDARAKKRGRERKPFSFEKAGIRIKRPP